MRKILPSNGTLIPDKARMVFKGDIFDVYQWSQELFDGATATFEMLKRQDTAQVIAVKDDKIIIIEDEQPHRGTALCLPGGRTESGDDSWEVAAKREMLEETGMQFRDWRLVTVEQPVRKIEWFTPVYLAQDCISQTEQTLDGGEKIEIRPVDFAQFREMVFDDAEPHLTFLRGLLMDVHTLEQLTSLQTFSGKESIRD